MNASYDVICYAAWDLIRHPPTTLAGCIALLRYADEARQRPGSWLDGSRSRAGWCPDSVWEHALQRVIADTLEKIVNGE